MEIKDLKHILRHKLIYKILKDSKTIKILNIKILKSSNDVLPSKGRSNESDVQ